MLQVLTPLKRDKSDISQTDCQSLADYRQIPINRVGIKGLRYPIEFSDKSGHFQDTIATVSLMVDLPADVKGTHMSRFVDVLHTHGRQVKGQDLAPLIKHLQSSLQAGLAEIEMDFPFFVEKSAPVTGEKGLVDYNVKLKTAGEGAQISRTVTVTVPVTTLCPCSKAISAFGAHNQRGYVTLAVRAAETIWVEDLIKVIEASASSEIFALLKRPDEKAVTEQAYENPVFVEDLVRNVAVRLNTLPQIEWYKVEAENMESIHNHSAYAYVEKPA